MCPIYFSMQNNPSKSGAEKPITVVNSRVNNLKGLSVSIPRNKLVVITGLSGSGKSSLAFDTLYADGQRRYVESLSAYARQFLGRMDKPDVDAIHGISPAIAIEQKVKTRNPRSTVGSSTEVYEYIKLLFARIGKTYSPVSGRLVKRHRETDITDHILALERGTDVLICAPLLLNGDRKLDQQLQVLMQQGFSRIMRQGRIMRIEDALKEIDGRTRPKDCFLVVDRVKAATEDPDLPARIADSAQIAFYEGKGKCLLHYRVKEKEQLVEFSNQFELDGIRFTEPSVNMFTFNNPFGACKTCEGFGSIIGISEELVVPNKNLSVYDGAVVCWRGEKMSEWKNQLINNAYLFDFPIHKPYNELSDEQR